MDEPQKIVDKSDLRRWRTELPNLYDDLGLNPYEYRLLGHYKRVGICTEGLQTTAARCKMSTSTASETRRALFERGLISLKRINTPHGPGWQVDVVDVWRENMAHYASDKDARDIDEIAAKLRQRGGKPSHSEAKPSHSEAKPSHSEAKPSHSEAKPSHSEAKPSPGEGKKEPLKNQPSKKEPIKNLEEEDVSSPLATLVKLYEENFGTLNGGIADDLKDAAATYPAEWFPLAFKAAARANARSWNYVSKVLENWKAQGGPNAPRKNGNGNGHKPAAPQEKTHQSEPRGYAGIREYMARMEKEKHG